MHVCNRVNGSELVATSLIGELKLEQARNKHDNLKLMALFPVYMSCTFPACFIAEALFYLSVTDKWDKRDYSHSFHYHRSRKTWQQKHYSFWVTQAMSFRAVGYMSQLVLSRQDVFINLFLSSVPFFFQLDQSKFSRMCITTKLILFLPQRSCEANAENNDLLFFFPCASQECKLIQQVLPKCNQVICSQTANWWKCVFVL